MASSTDVARITPMSVATMDDNELRRMFSVAKALAMSKRFPTAQTADEAFAVILLGRDLGLSPTQALTGIYIVEGKPQVAAVTLGSFVRRTAAHDYRVVEHTDEACAIDFLIDGEVIGTSRFTQQDRERAGLKLQTRKGEPSNWAKYPRNMLFARAMSNGVKWFMPECTGGVPVYYEGEIVEGTVTPMLDEGRGDGSAPGWGDLSADAIADVEAVIARAEMLGHGGLSNLATAQMALVGQDDEVVRQWCARTMSELDEFDARRTGDEPTDDTAGTEALEAKRAELLDLIAAGEQEGATAQTLEALRTELAKIEAALGPVEPSPEQEGLDL